MQGGFLMLKFILQNPSKMTIDNLTELLYNNHRYIFFAYGYSYITVMFL